MFLQLCTYGALYIHRYSLYIFFTFGFYFSYFSTVFIYFSLNQGKYMRQTRKRFLYQRFSLRRQVRSYGGINGSSLSRPTIFTTQGRQAFRKDFIGPFGHVSPKDRPRMEWRPFRAIWVNSLDSSTEQIVLWFRRNNFYEGPDTSNRFPMKLLKRYLPNAHILLYYLDLGIVLSAN